PGSSRPDRGPGLPATAAAGSSPRPSGPLAGQRQRAPLPRLRLRQPAGAVDVLGDDPMSVVAMLAQVALIAVGSPFLIGLTRQIRARLEGRAGAGIAQPARDLRKLLRKETITPDGT